MAIFFLIKMLNFQCNSSVCLMCAHLENGGQIITSGNITLSGTTVVIDANSNIKTNGCLIFTQPTNIQLNVTDEQKQNYADNGQTSNIAEFSCIEGSDNLQLSNNGDCDNGVQENYQVNNTAISVVFGHCLPTWAIALIVVILAVLVIGSIVVFATPLKYKIFPFLARQRNTRKTLKKRSDEMKRKSQRLDIEKRLSTLNLEISQIDTDSKRLSTMIDSLGSVQIDDLEKGSL